jgi:hypothetical protein
MPPPPKRLPLLPKYYTINSGIGTHELLQGIGKRTQGEEQILPPSFSFSQQQLWAQRRIPLMINHPRGAVKPLPFSLGKICTSGEKLSQMG